jgi:hypothetical protein
VNAQFGQQPITDESADNAYAKIGDKTEARAAHDLARKPARENADEDDDDETFTGQGMPFLRFAASRINSEFTTPEMVTCRAVASQRFEAGCANS